DPEREHNRTLLEHRARLERLRPLTENLRTARAISERLFPDVAAASVNFHQDTRLWVLLSHDGEVLRSGRISLERGLPFVVNDHLASLFPGLRFGEAETHTMGEPRYALGVMYVWLAQDSPLPPPD